MTTVRPAASISKHLQSASYPGAKRLGRGEGYKYAHDFEGGFVEQDYGVPRGSYYHPTDRGKEAEFKKRLEEFGAASPEGVDE